MGLSFNYSRFFFRFTLLMFISGDEDEQEEEEEENVNVNHISSENVVEGTNERTKERERNILVLVCLWYILLYYISYLIHTQLEHFSNC